MEPVEFKVLVRPEVVEEQVGRIILPDIVRDKEQISQDKAEIIAVGGNAFEGWEPPIPKVGDRILMNRHAGYTMKIQEDGRRVEYRVINDKDITLILGEEDE